MTLSDAIRDAKQAARAANVAESAGGNWGLCWEVCRCWCVAAGLAKTKRVRVDYAERAWCWAKKAVAEYELRPRRAS